MLLFEVVAVGEAAGSSACGVGVVEEVALSFGGPHVPSLLGGGALCRRIAGAERGQVGPATGGSVEDRSDLTEGSRGR